MSPLIRWETTDDGIVILTLDDPEQSTNTMNGRYLEAMDSTVDRLVAERDSITGVVLTSAKEGFLAGADLKDLSTATSGTETDGDAVRAALPADRLVPHARHTRSTIVAMPMPPPTHRVASP